MPEYYHTPYSVLNPTETPQMGLGASPPEVSSDTPPGLQAVPPGVSSYTPPGLQAVPGAGDQGSFGLTSPPETSPAPQPVDAGGFVPGQGLNWQGASPTELYTQFQALDPGLQQSYINYYMNNLNPTQQAAWQTAFGQGNSTLSAGGTGGNMSGYTPPGPGSPYGGTSVPAPTVAGYDPTMGGSPPNGVAPGGAGTTVPAPTPAGYDPTMGGSSGISSQTSSDYPTGAIGSQTFSDYPTLDQSRNYTGAYPQSWIDAYNAQSPAGQTAMQQRYSGMSPEQIMADWNQNVAPNYMSGTDPGSILRGSAIPLAGMGMPQEPIAPHGPQAPGTNNPAAGNVYQGPGGVVGTSVPDYAAPDQSRNYTGAYPQEWIDRYNAQSPEGKTAMVQRYYGMSPEQISADWNTTVQPGFAPGTTPDQILGYGQSQGPGAPPNRGATPVQGAGGTTMWQGATGQAVNPQGHRGSLSNAMSAVPGQPGYDPAYAIAMNDPNRYTQEMARAETRRSGFINPGEEQIPWNARLGPDGNYYTFSGETPAPGSPATIEGQGRLRAPVNVGGQQFGNLNQFLKFMGTSTPLEQQLKNQLGTFDPQGGSREPGEGSLFDTLAAYFGQNTKKMAQPGQTPFTNYNPIGLLDALIKSGLLKTG